MAKMLAPAPTHPGSIYPPCIRVWQTAGNAFPRYPGYPDLPSAYSAPSVLQRFGFGVPIARPVPACPALTCPRLTRPAPGVQWTARPVLRFTENTSLTRIRPLGHPTFSTGPRNVFHWATQTFPQGGPSVSLLPCKHKTRGHRAAEGRRTNRRKDNYPLDCLALQSGFWFTQKGGVVTDDL
jgi:hypothetical protein